MRSETQYLGKVYPRTGHEAPKGRVGVIAVLFL